MQTGPEFLSADPARIPAQSTSSDSIVVHLAIENAALRAGLEPGKTAIALVDLQGLVIASNDAWNVTVATRGGAVGGADPATGEQKLRKVIGQAAARDARAADSTGKVTAIEVILADGRYLLLPVLGFPGVIALAMLPEPDAMPFARSAVADRLVSEHGLTRAEAEVAIAINEGVRLAEIAARRGVSPHTVRNQLKSALSKAGAARQAHLAVIVERLRR